MTNCKNCTVNCVYSGTENESRCKGYVGTVTNADRIRAMSDEKLAKECVKQFPMYLWPNGVRTIYFDFDKPNKNNAVNAWMKWLQQPAEGE